MRSSLFIAIFITLAAAIWIGSGVLFGSSDSVEAVQSQDQPEMNENGLVQVRVRMSTAAPMQGEMMVTGRTQASRKVDLKAETAGQVIELLAEKGDVVQEGQILAKLEVRERAARVNEAQQLVNQRNIQYKAAKKLASKGFNSQVRLAEARAELEAARAELKFARVDLSKTTLKAPFDGVINDQFIEVGDYLAVGDQIFSFVDLDPIEVHGFLTENQVIQIEAGIKAQAVLLNEDRVIGTITYIAPAANTETRTFGIEMQAENPEHTIKEGLTADIKIPLPKRKAHKVSPSVLTLADDGTVGLKIVDDNNVVRFIKAKLLKDTTDHLWVGDLPDSIRIITVGKDFVTEGQKVDPAVATGDGLL